MTWEKHVLVWERRMYIQPTGFWWVNVKKWLLVKRRCRWKNNIKTDVQEAGWESSERIIGSSGGML
jgi:hypothetical protein